MEVRKESLLIYYLYILLLLVSITNSARSAQSVSVDIGYQGNPAIGNGIYVWEQTIDQGQHYDIYGRFSCDDEIRRLSSSGQARWPDIYKDLVIWSDKRRGVYDIWGYDLKASKEFEICRMDDNQIYPAIHNNIIVWVTGEYPCWPAVWGYSLNSKCAFKICDTPGNKWRPDIFDNRVVWGDYRTGNWDIYCSDISNFNDPNEMVIDSSGKYQRSAVIYGTLIAYEDGPNLGIYDLVSKQKSSYPTGLINDLDIYDNQVVVSQWGGATNGYDIWGYRISRRFGLKITPYTIACNKSDQYCVVLDGQKVLWCDDSICGYYQRDIYYSMLEPLLAALPSEYPDLKTLSILGRSWKSIGTSLEGDIDQNGEVEMGDLGLFIQIYRSGTLIN